MNSMILSTGTRAVFHTILVFSVFLLFAGHNAPGGGFIGGLVAGAALVLRFAADGPNGSAPAPARPEALLGAGVLLAAGMAAVPWIAGNQVLESVAWSVSLPAIGSVKITTVALFDIGVYLVVVGLVLAVLRTLGQELDA